MALRLLFLLASIASSQLALAQTELRGTLTNAYTGEPVANAVVAIKNSPTRLLTDSNGHFQVAVPENVETLLLAVKALGMDTTFEVFPQSTSLLELRVRPKGFNLATATIRGLTARQVVQKAIVAIPQNYPDSSCVYYGHYRQYQQSGERFQNLVEAQVAAAVLPRKEKNGLKADWLFAVLNSKRQSLTPTKIEDVDIREGLSEQLFEEDPVYFIANSSLAGRLLDVSQFRFDSTYAGPDEFRIYYTSELSSEDHGFGQKFATHAVHSESYETGLLVIDRKSFAFKRIRRVARRMPGFDYYHVANWVMPSRALSRELVDGQLDIQYVQRGNKWFLAQISHGYFNDYYTHQTFARLKGRLGEFFEWHTHDISSDLPKGLVRNFTSRPYVQFLPDVESGYGLSQTTFPFVFFPEETVKSALLDWRK